MQIVLHIGLHKTATRFLDHDVFRPLRQHGVAYNPVAIMDALSAAFSGDPSARSAILRERQRLERTGTSLLLISRPGISGDMFDNHRGYLEARDAMRDLFPKARVLLFVRHPPDWLVSAYRQSLVKGAGGPIETFLNFYGGRFREKPAHHVRGMRNLSALKLCFADIYRAYVEAFGEERVYLVRQEDLRDRPEKVRALLAHCLGRALPAEHRRRARNRGFSALAIFLFCGGWRRPNSATRIREGRPPRFVRAYLQRPVRRSRAIFIRHIFDRISYVDWDLLARGGMRRDLERHYRSESEALKAAASECFKILDQHEPGSRSPDEPEARPDATTPSR